MSQNDEHRGDRALPEGDGAKLSIDLSEEGAGGALAQPQSASFNPNLLALEGDDHAGDDSHDLFAKKASPYRGQTMFIAVVLVAGAGAIFGMRQLAVAAAHAGEHFSLNFQPQAEDLEQAKKFNRVMQELERSGRPMQVPIDRLDGSPFQFLTRDEEMGEPEPGEDPSLAASRLRERERMRELERARQAAAVRDAEITTALKTLELQGVVGGSAPVARISGETFREGDAVADTFSVARIEGRGVILTVDDRYFVLQLGREPREFQPE